MEAGKEWTERVKVTLRNSTTTSAANSFSELRQSISLTVRVSTPGYLGRKLEGLDGAAASSIFPLDVPLEEITLLSQSGARPAPALNTSVACKLVSFLFIAQSMLFKKEK